MRLNRAAAVLGDAQVFETERLSRLGHFFQRVVTVTCDCMAMKCAA